MGVHFLLCWPLGGNRKCLEISQAGLRKRRGLLPHPVFRHPPPHWEADVLFGACTRTVCSERSHQDLAYVASGRYDGYFQDNLNLWDIAAGMILIREAGGIINEIDLAVLNNIKVIASSTDIHSKLLKKIDNF